MFYRTDEIGVGEAVTDTLRAGGVYLPPCTGSYVFALKLRFIGVWDPCEPNDLYLAFLLSKIWDLKQRQYLRWTLLIQRCTTLLCSWYWAVLQQSSSTKQCMQLAIQKVPHIFCKTYLFWKCQDFVQTYLTWAESSILDASLVQKPVFATVPVFV